MSSSSQKNDKDAEFQSVQVECEESEEVSDAEGQQKSDGWNQYNEWVRNRLLEKWSNEANELRNCGLPAKEEIDEETLVEMIMFGIALNRLRGVV